MNIQSISASPAPQSSYELGAASRAATPAATPIAPSAQAEPNQAQTVAPEQLKAAVDSVREYVRPINNSVEFSINEDVHRVVVTVVDNSSKEVIRQIPSEEMIAIAKALDSIKGLLFRQKV